LSESQFWPELDSSYKQNAAAMKNSIHCLFQGTKKLPENPEALVSRMELPTGFEPATC
jgi:hypothetical protein